MSGDATPRAAEAVVAFWKKAGPDKWWTRTYATDSLAQRYARAAVDSGKVGELPEDLRLFLSCVRAP